MNTKYSRVHSDSITESSVYVVKTTRSFSVASPEKNSANLLTALLSKEDELEFPQGVVEISSR